VDTNVYSDAKYDIYAFEKNHKESYSQRVADLAVVTAGEAGDVKTYIVVPPTICKLFDPRIARMKSNMSIRRPRIRLFPNYEPTDPKANSVVYQEGLFSCDRRGQRSASRSLKTILHS